MLLTAKPLIQSSFLLGSFASGPSGWFVLRCHFGLRLRFRCRVPVRIALVLGNVRPWTGAWRGSRSKLGGQQEKDVEGQSFVQFFSS